MLHLRYSRYAPDCSPIQSIQGKHTLKYIKCEINKVYPEDKNLQLAYTGSKFGIKFNVKCKSKKLCHDDLTYSV